VSQSLGGRGALVDLHLQTEREKVLKPITLCYEACSTVKTLKTVERLSGFCSCGVPLVAIK
jgi:hypothetical protein